MSWSILFAFDHAPSVLIQIACSDEKRAAVQEGWRQGKLVPPSLFTLQRSVLYQTGIVYNALQVAPKWMKRRTKTNQDRRA